MTRQESAWNMCAYRQQLGHAAPCNDTVPTQPAASGGTGSAACNSTETEQHQGPGGPMRASAPTDASHQSKVLKSHRSRGALGSQGRPQSGPPPTPRHSQRRHASHPLRVAAPSQETGCHVRAGSWHPPPTVEDTHTTVGEGSSGSNGSGKSLHEGMSKTTHARDMVHLSHICMCVSIFSSLRASGRNTWCAVGGHTIHQYMPAV